MSAEQQLQQLEKRLERLEVIVSEILEYATPESREKILALVEQKHE